MECNVWIIVTLRGKIWTGQTFWFRYDSIAVVLCSCLSGLFSLKILCDVCHETLPMYWDGKTHLCLYGRVKEIILRMTMAAIGCRRRGGIRWDWLHECSRGLDMGEDCVLPQDYEDNQVGKKRRAKTRTGALMRSTIRYGRRYGEESEKVRAELKPSPNLNKITVWYVSTNTIIWSRH